MGLFSEAGLIALEAGRSAFNRGEYFEAHELWEEVWQEVSKEGPNGVAKGASKERGGAGRLFVQGLIQIAAGLHHLQHRRARPAAALLHKGLDKISRGADARPGGLRVEVLAHDVTQLLAELEALDAKLPDPRRLTL